MCRYYNLFEDRKDMDADYAMVVAYSRKAAYTMYQKFLELRPDYKDVVNMIITPSNKDSEEMQKAIGTKNDKKELEIRFKNESNDSKEKFKIAIVVDMWLTGFDVPRLGVMYIDKPMKAHNLMQAIARVNRVYKSKPAGLIVDYIGLKAWLLDALKTYTSRDQRQIVDNEELVNALKDKIEIIDNILNGFDYSCFNNLDNTVKYNLIKEGANLVLSSEEKKKRFMKHSLDAKNLYTLCNGILESEYKDKVLYIISVRSFISKISNDNKLDVSEINKTVGIMLAESIKEDELINLGELSRGKSLELLSENMMTKLRSLKDKNVAAEILSRAIKTTINDIGKINLTLQKKFSTKFNKIVDAYNERTDLADIEKIIEEMINLKREIEEELEKGNDYNLSPEEKAFFDALGADSEIKELMQDEILVQIAKELVEIINENLTLDAFKREDARARIRVNIRRLLIKYKSKCSVPKSSIEMKLRGLKQNIIDNLNYNETKVSDEMLDSFVDKIIVKKDRFEWKFNFLSNIKEQNGEERYDEVYLTSINITQDDASEFFSKQGIFKNYKKIIEPIRVDIYI